MDNFEKLNLCYDNIKNKIPYEVSLGIVLGSGLGDYVDTINVDACISYSDIEGFPTSTVVGHKGQFVFAKINGVNTVLMQGRVHFYEGYDVNDVVLPIRLMNLMGAKNLLLTNAAGGANPDFEVGSLMLINDHISQFIKSPLIGKNIDELGTRFPDMSEVYDKEFQIRIKDVADKEKIKLVEGVYLQFTGPNYETPAEVRMARALGADALGMSTAIEAMVAKHMGMRIAGISLISNKAAGIGDTPLSHKEVQEIADRVSPIFKKLVTSIVPVLVD